MCLEEKLLDIVNRLISELTFEKVKYNNLFNALVCLFDLWRRIPSENNWVVYVSTFLENQKLNPETRESLERFTLAASSGEDLRPWLHHSVFTPENKQDLLMNDWGVQHYHMGLNLEHDNKRKYIERTSVLLYAFHVEKKKSIYLIGVFDHKSFGDREALRVIRTNWPSLLEQSKIRRVGSISSCDISKEDVSKLRKASINVVNDVDGEFYFGPGGGITASGHSIEAVDFALFLIKRVKLIENEISYNRLEIEVLVDRGRRSFVFYDLKNDSYFDLFQ